MTSPETQLFIPGVGPATLTFAEAPAAETLVRIKAALAGMWQQPQSGIGSFAPAERAEIEYASWLQQQH